ncbi:MAG: response regulator, partial [Bacteroidota bacterium]
MNVLIIEDEIPAFKQLQKLLLQARATTKVLEHLDSVESAVEWFTKYGMLPDLIFMDIQLADGLSFQIFQEIDITKPIIFTTAFDQYMLHAFKVNSIDYLLKPISFMDLSKALKKLEGLKKQLNPPDNLNAAIRQIS